MASHGELVEEGGEGEGEGGEGAHLVERHGGHGEGLLGAARPCCFVQLLCSGLLVVHEGKQEEGRRKEKKKKRKKKKKWKIFQT
jgi:hypothetical protein